MDAVVQPAVAPLDWDTTVPGDKSISHRALMLGAVAEGTTTVTNLAPGGDVRSTASCLRALGVEIAFEGTTARVVGRGPRGLTLAPAPLDCGNSGTTMRLLCGLLGGAGVPFQLTGDASLGKRPMRRVCAPLREMGMRIHGQERGLDEFAPLFSEGSTPLHGAEFELDVASAQVKSAILFAGLWAEGRTEVLEPAQSRDHTERMLELFGARVATPEAGWSRVDGGATLRAADVHVPGDLSSAAFPLAAAALVPGSRVIVRGVGMNPGRTGFVDLLMRMGAVVVLEEPRVVSGEPRATLVLRHAALEATEVLPREVPALIDELPLVGILGAVARGETVVRGAGELRAKESDRIRQVVAGLTAMGADAEELPDGFVVRGPTRLRGARIDSAQDHRIAMAFAVAGLAAEGPTTISGAEWASISFPSFWEMIGATLASPSEALQ